MAASLFAAVLLASLHTARAVDGSCYELVSATRPDLFRRVGSRPDWTDGLRKGLEEAKLTLGAPLAEDVAFKLCGLCTTADLVNWLDPAGEQLCRDMAFPQVRLSLRKRDAEFRLRGAERADRPPCRS